jgi:phytoene synthase
MKVTTILSTTLVLCIDNLLLELAAGLAVFPRASTTFLQPKCQSPSITRYSQLWATVPRQKDNVSVQNLPHSMREGRESSSNTRGGSSGEKIANELSLGKTLDGGPVIDFGAVKDDKSRAEMALSAARKRYEASLNRGMKGTSHPSRQRLMGINEEVVAEVGYEIGEFVKEFSGESGEDPAVLVQKCASYLRSKAGQGTFPQLWKSGKGNVDFSPEQILLYDRLLARAYDESGIVTSSFAKTFYLGTQVLPEPAMKAIWAVYVWCRRTDEIVDAPRPDAEDPNAEMLTDLSEWEIRLERLFDRGEVVDVLDLPLLDCKVKYPSLPVTPFSDMIRGMLMDIPGLGQERYDTWDELHLYCYRVAGTVGLMSMPIFGCAPGFTDEMAK